MLDSLHASTVARLAVRATHRLLLGLAAVAAVVVIFQFVGVVLGRITYPFDLEWMESGVIAHVRRIAAGRPLYGEPSIEFTPFIYPPFYYYVSALFSSVLGLGHFAPRLVSFLAILGSFVLIGRWVVRESGDVVAGLVAAAAFCGCYGAADYWYDVARVDSLFLLLLLAGLSLVRVAARPWQAALGGALLALSCFTKQSAVPYALCGVVMLWFRAPKLSLVAAAALGGLVLAGTLFFNVSSNGYFWYYVMELPAQHSLEWSRWREAFTGSICTPAAPMLLAAMALVSGAGFGGQMRWAWAFNAVFVLVAACMSMTSLLKTGGYVNALIPAYAAFSIAFGIMFAALHRAPGFRLGRTGTAALATAVFLGQLFLLDYDQTAGPVDLVRGVRSPLPTYDDYVAGKHMEARLATLPQPLWVTTSSEYSRVDGAVGRITHTMGVVDVLKANGRRGKKIRAELTRAIREHEFACIVTDRTFGFLTLDFKDLIERYYRPTGNVMDRDLRTSFWPRSGAWIRPEQIWVPR